MDFKTETYGDVSVISVYLQRATLKNAMGFRDYVMNLIKTGAIKLVVDLSMCDYVDSTFLGALVASLKKANSLRGDLQLIYNNKTATIVFEMTSMNRVFKIHQTIDEALESFGEKVEKSNSA